MKRIRSMYDIKSLTNRIILLKKSVYIARVQKTLKERCQSETAADRLLRQKCCYRAILIRGRSDASQNQMFSGIRDGTRR